MFVEVNVEEMTAFLWLKVVVKYVFLFFSILLGIIFFMPLKWYLILHRYICLEWIYFYILRVFFRIYFSQRCYWTSLTQILHYLWTKRKKTPSGKAMNCLHKQFLRKLYLFWVPSRHFKLAWKARLLWFWVLWWCKLPRQWIPCSQSFF